MAWRSSPHWKLTTKNSAEAAEDALLQIGFGTWANERLAEPGSIQKWKAGIYSFYRCICHVYMYVYIIYILYGKIDGKKRETQSNHGNFNTWHLFGAADNSTKSF